ncbi:MAG: two-component system nitrogen regulation sensor histidine kinase NtrY, partial [Yoonia sp.]
MLLPSGGIALWFVWSSELAPWVQYLLTAVIVVVPGIFQVLLRRQISRPLQTLSNLLAGLREGDYSINARGGDGGDAMGLVLAEANSLIETMREQRLGAREAT